MSITSDLSCRHVFLDMSICLYPACGQIQPPTSPDQALCMAILSEAIQRMFGQVAHASSPPMILKHESMDQTSFSSSNLLIRLDKRGDESKFCSACSCLTTYDNHPVKIIIHRSSPFLSSLAVNNRYNH